MRGSDWEDEDVDHLIEIRGLYDGFSVIVLKDGRWLNRWRGSSMKYLEKKTDEWIKEAQSEADALT